MASGEALFNPYLPEFHADPYPFYHRLRAVAPVYQTPMGFWVLTRYDDVLTVLRDPRFGRDGFEQMPAAIYAEDRAESSRLPRSMLFRDPPDHTRLRALVSKAFTPRVIERMREHIQDIVHRLLGRVRDAKGMDVITDLAYPLPVTVICEMLGVPTGDEGVIRQWSSDVARSLAAIGMPSDIEVVARGRAARRELGDYFRRLLPERRRRPQDDLLSLLIAAEEAGDTLSEGELLATCVLLFIAGHETTVNLIGNGMLALLRHPDQLGRLRADPSIARAAVEELLRFDPPVTLTGRVAMEDIEVGGITVEAGEMAVLLLGAANRDPAAFENPDRLDLTRPDNHHAAFGHGIHFCLGAPLARLEGQVALTALVQRFEHLELATDEPEYKEN